jgi:hypothetical protein
MKMPRLTVRRLMIAVAILGSMFAGWSLMARRAATYREISAYHAEAWGRIDTTGTPEADARVDWHRAMAEKYRDAARYPWLPVATDPPEPE